MKLLLFSSWANVAFYSYFVTVGHIEQRTSHVVGIGEIQMRSRNDSI